MNKKRVFFITISWILVAITMLLILMFSSESQEVSAKTSQSVVKEVLSIFMDEDKITEEVVIQYQIPIRKVAHFSIYMLLGFCLSNAFVHSLKLKKYYSLAFSVPCAFLYAIVDEFVYQNLSSGRGPSFIDVLIDTSGAIMGLFLFLILIVFTKKIIKKEVGI